MTDVQQDCEDAKTTRDWVFTEREKIVRERESVKTLCDKMRHERDDAVSSYMEAVKDADELKKQKSDAQREMKELKLVASPCSTIYSVYAHRYVTKIVYTQRKATTSSLKKIMNAKLSFPFLGRSMKHCGNRNLTDFMDIAVGTRPSTATCLRSGKQTRCA